MKDFFVRGFLYLRYCVIPYLFVKDKSLFNVAVKLHVKDLEKWSMLYAEKAVATFPVDEQLLWRVSLWFNRTKPEWVLELYENFFRKKPNHVPDEYYLSNLVSAYNKMKRYDDAFKLVKGFNNQYLMHYERMNIFTAQKDLNSALEELEQAFQYTTSKYQRESLLIGKIWLLMDMNRLEEALATSEELIERFPATHSYIYKSKILTKQNHIEEALEVAQYGLSIAKTDAEKQRANSMIDKILDFLDEEIHEENV